MLQISPDAENRSDVLEKTDDGLYCARCEALVTRTRWAISKEGHEHVFFNPAGHVFRILCFSEAPGARDYGPATDDFTWFKGYDWVLALCAECGAHLGWRYEGAAAPPVFFGLIKDRLTATGERPDGA